MKPFAVAVKYLFVVFLLVLLLIPGQSKSYAILTHEAIIDASWEKSIKPLLLKKFPNATADDLRLAHSYAYGGTMMTDIGYSPFGSEYFTNLIHYCRTGDFVENLLSEAQNLNEYAYALGALCHYMADVYGHSVGTNRVVPKVYPKVGAKYGEVVTYEEDHASHSRVELAFDVLQIARNNYATQEYHDLIGFNVAVPVLERAFYKTYGQDVNEIFGNIDHSINNFRWAVNSLMPTITRSAWLLKKNDIQKTNPGITARQFHYHMERKKYYKEFGHDHDRPKFKERLLAFLIEILPKVGPFKSLKFREVGPDGEKQFIKSFDTVMMNYSIALQKLGTGNLELPNRDFDTGKLTAPEEYGLTDDTYCDLVLKLNETKYAFTTAPLKQSLLNYYSKADTAAIQKRDESKWKKTSLALQQMRLAVPINADSLRSAEAIQEQKRKAKLDTVK
jgi:hypothetical protein